MTDSMDVTDAHIIEAIKRCKFLACLDVSKCPRVTNRSLDALNAEMERRHGVGTEPTSFEDREYGRFRFICWGTGITADAKKTANKWISFVGGIEEHFMDNNYNFLNVSGCPRVTNNFLDALNAEMERRHGGGTEPTSSEEIKYGRFRLICENTGITEEAKQKANKWIRFD